MMEKRVLQWCCAASLACPTVAGAQVADTIAGGSISGTVYDSVAGRVVAGAQVNVVSAARISSRVISVISDEDGHFLVPALAPGRYVVSFQHIALDSLALTAPELLVTVDAGRRVSASLAVPSASTIRTTFCGARQAEDSTGVLLGRIRDAHTANAVATGQVEIHWQQLLFGRGALALHPRTHKTPVGADGWYAQCDVPAGIEIGAFAASGSDSTGFVGLVVPPLGVLRQDFILGGRTTVRGSVTSESGRPVASARVGVVGREHQEITDRAGRFALLGIPAGTQTVEVRALGHAPERRRLELGHAADTTLTFRMTTLKRMLDTITVVGQRVYDRDRSGFLRRARANMGFSMDGEAIARSRAVDTSQLLRRAPGAFVNAHAMNRQLLIRNRAGSYCTPTIYLDGIRMLGPASEDLDIIVQPHQLDGLELYRNMQAPPEYQDINQCGVLLLWTRARITR
jgi:hypothetical protein